jgi:uncharacterized protein YecE (DUF72 family)
MTMARSYIGLSGYSYKAWQGPGRFYPDGLKQPQFLSYYAQRYETVELDGTWYRMPSAEMVRGWTAHTPDGFLFAPKAHRQVTHLRRLKPEALESLRVMTDRLAPLAAVGRLGPILLQLPPNLRRDDERLDAFLSGVPKDLRWAMEFRHASWNVAEVEALLRTHRVAWVAAETDETLAERRDTAAFRYARLRRSAYDEGALREWARWCQEAVVAGKDCFVFLKHEDEGAPWIWADRLVEFTKTLSHGANGT